MRHSNVFRDKAIRSIHTVDYAVHIRQDDNDYVGSRLTLCPSICSGAESCKLLESALKPTPTPLLPLPIHSCSQTEHSIPHLFLNKGIQNCIFACFSNVCKNPGVTAGPAVSPAVSPALTAGPLCWAALGSQGVARGRAPDLNASYEQTRLGARSRGDPGWDFGL